MAVGDSAGRVAGHHLSLHHTHAAYQGGVAVLEGLLLHTGFSEVISFHVAMLMPRSAHCNVSESSELMQPAAIICKDPLTCLSASETGCVPVQTLLCANQLPDQAPKFTQEAATLLSTSLHWCRIC